MKKSFMKRPYQKTVLVIKNINESFGTGLKMANYTGQGFGG
jgi:hypothetical protein